MGNKRARAVSFVGTQNNNRAAGAGSVRFCSYCGNRMNPSAAFCTKCGKAVKRTVQSVPEEGDGSQEEFGMDVRKVAQTLKEIFDKYGTEIMREQQRFLYAVLDFLSVPEYRKEKLVFRDAIKSGALLPFAVPGYVTDEIAKTALPELQQKGHLTQKDARFVIECILAATESGERKGNDGE